MTTHETKPTAQAKAWKLASGSGATTPESEILFSGHQLASLGCPASSNSRTIKRLQ
jgi:hypothetical protein